MLRRVLGEERGYSLVEVMVSIFILAVAIMPMVGMFDMGLRSAVIGSNYEEARALANANLEKVLSRSYSDAKANYKPVNDTSSPAGQPVSCSQPGFTCNVTTTYVDWNSTSKSYENVAASANPSSKNEMRITVTVTWDNGNTYTITGLKTL